MLCPAQTRGRGPEPALHETCSLGWWPASPCCGGGPLALQGQPGQGGPLPGSLQTVGDAIERSPADGQASGGAGVPGAGRGPAFWGDVCLGPAGTCDRSVRSYRAPWLRPAVSQPLPSRKSRRCRASSRAGFPPAGCSPGLPARGPQSAGSSLAFHFDVNVTRPPTQHGGRGQGFYVAVPVCKEQEQRRSCGQQAENAAPWAAFLSGARTAFGVT